MGGGRWLHQGGQMMGAGNGAGTRDGQGQGGGGAVTDRH